MTEIDAKTVMKLRQETGAPMMDCKKALAESEGDWERAKEALRLKGVKDAQKRSARAADEGRVFSYVHGGGRIGVLLEIDCETDFVAKNEQFVEFGNNLCHHLAFTRPKYLRREDVDAAEAEKERTFLLQQVKEQMGDKPQAIQEKTVEGRMRQFFEDRCLLEQKFIKDDTKTIEQYREEMVAKIGENLQIARFAVFAVGED